MSKLFTIIFVSLFLPLLFSLNILLFLNPSFFEFLYPKLSAPDKFGWSSEVQQQQAKDVAGMLLSEQPFQSKQLSQYQITMTENEQSHMNDVAALLKSSKVFSAFLCGILIATFTKAYSAKKVTRSRIQKVLKNALIIYLVISVLISFVVFAMWSTFFTTFHELLFAQGNWSFPENSTLIRLFPEIFWQKTAILLISLPVIECGIFYLLTLFPRQTLRNDKIAE